METDLEREREDVDLCFSDMDNTCMSAATEYFKENKPDFMFVYQNPGADKFAQNVSFTCHDTSQTTRTHSTHKMASHK